MDKIVEQLKELVGVCQVRIKKVDAEKAQNTADRATNKKNKEANAEKDESLKRESAALDRKKLIVSTVAEAEQIKKKASELGNAVKADREKLDRDQKVHAEKIESDNKDIERKKGKCAKDRKALDRDAENYKDKIMAEITKNIKKEKKI